MQSEASITAKAQITDNWGPEVNLTGQIARSILGPRMWVDASCALEGVGVFVALVGRVRHLPVGGAVFPFCFTLGSLASLHPFLQPSLSNFGFTLMHFPYSC